MNQNSEALTPRQFKFLVALHILGSSLISIPAGLINNAQQDAWIAFLIAMIFDLVFLSIFITLGNLQPSHSIAQTAENILGKWLGGFYSLTMVFYGLISCCDLVWYLSNFLNAFIPTIPEFYIHCCFLLIIVLILSSNLTALGRLIELCFPIITTLIILISLILILDIKPLQILPVFDNPFPKILKASLQSTSYLGASCINLLAFYPYRISTQKKPHRFFFIGYLYGSILLLLIIVLTILTIGTTAINANNSTYLFTMLVNIKNVFERSGGFLALIWFSTLFFKTITYYSYATVHLTQILKIKNQQSLVMVLGLIILAYTPIIYRDSVQEGIWDTTTWISHIGYISLLLSLIFLSIAKIKEFFTYQKSKI